MSLVDLPDKTSLTNCDMENKENAESGALEKSSVALSSLNSSVVLMQTTRGINCGPATVTSAAVSKVAPAELKNPSMSFTHAFLVKKSAKENQMRTATPISNARLPEKRVLGSYRGKVVSSKINSFRKLPEDKERKNSLAVSAKPVAKTEPARNRVTNTAAASIQTKPPLKVSVCQPKPIVNDKQPKSYPPESDKQPVKTSVNKAAVQKKPNKNWTSALEKVPRSAAKPEQRPQKAVPPTGASADLVAESNGIKHAASSKPASNRKSSLLQSAEARRRQLAEWQASKRKAVAKPPAPLPTDAQLAVKAQQTVKETFESFWTAIEEEDEQQLFSNTVNQTLTECLCLIEKGWSAGKIHSTLEELVRTIPDVKKFAKYWVCRMHLEQLGTLEKVLDVYEEAVLAGAQPKDELRDTLAAIMKGIKDLSRSDGECSKEEITLNCTVEGNLDEKVEVQPNSEAKPEDKETSMKAEACLESKPESLPSDEERRIKESSQMPPEVKTEQNVSKRLKNITFQTPNNDGAGSYMIKYNVSTTPSLNSVVKKLLDKNSDSAVKDLKLLTPVRRSLRLQGKVCEMPSMLKDHNPCVSSLDQLGELGREATAFVYRPNNALYEVLEGQDKM